MSIYSKEFILEQLHIYYTQTGEVPNSSRWNLLPSKRTIYNVFDSWTNAIEEAGFERYYHKPQQVSCRECDKKFMKHYRQIIKYNNHYCSSSCAATFHNKNKKIGFRRSKLEIWLHKQITKKYENLDISCNSTKDIGYELDIYIPELKLAFEINGIFHYKPIYGEKKYNRTQVIDRIKKEKCKELGIELYIIDTQQQLNFSEKGSIVYLKFIENIIDAHYASASSDSASASSSHFSCLM